MTHRTTKTRLKDLAEFRYQIRRYLAFSESTSETQGIPGQQYQMLQVVGTAPTQPTISYIAERMALRHNSTVELVDRGTKAGLVRRVTDESDHRRSVVEMTPKGHELLLKLAAQHLIELERVAPEIVRSLQAVFTQ